MNTAIKKILLLFTLMALFPSAGIADVITIRADEWSPYNGIPNSAKPGYAIELAQVIFAKAGHTIDYKNLNWARATKEVLAGKYDCAIGATTGDIEGAVFPKESMGSSTNAFFVKKGAAWRLDGVNSLKSVSVAIIRDYAYGDDYDAYFKSVKNPRKVQIVSGDAPLDLNIKKLIAGRVDVVIEDKNVFNAKAAEMNVADKVEFAGADADDISNDLFLAFSPKKPKSQEYAKIWDDGIRTMRANGELQKILAKYGLEDWLR